jgi:hypothetical protein
MKTKIKVLFASCILLSFSVLIYSKSHKMKKSKTKIDTQKILTTKCAKCHKAPDPEKYDKMKWKKMVKAMSARAKLTKREKAALLGIKK